MAYDVARIRSEFPSLESGWAQFDGPGGTQTPRAVGEAVASVLTGPLSNRGTTGESEERAEAAVHGFRLAMADLVNGHPRGIVHGRSATQLTYDFSRHLSKAWGEHDEIVVTRLDHDSNVRPWVQAAERVGATVRWVDFDPETGELSTEAVEAAVTDRTRLVAVTAASNLIGTMPDVPAIAAATHAAGALRLRRRRALHRARTARRRRARRRLLHVLAVQVPRPALRRARRSSRAARDDRARQAAAGDERRARAVRVRHAALRAARRRHCGGRRARRARLVGRVVGRGGCRDLAPRAPDRLVRGAARARGGAAIAHRAGPGRAAGRDPLVARLHAAHRRCWRRSPATRHPTSPGASPKRRCSHRAATSTRSRRRADSDSATPADCAWGSRPTRTPTTSTGCSTGWGPRSPRSSNGR